MTATSRSTRQQHPGHKGQTTKRNFAATTVTAAITIGSAHAPTEFSLPIDIPEGTALTLNANGSGSVTVSVTVQGEELGSFDTPWAPADQGGH